MSHDTGPPWDSAPTPIPQGVLSFWREKKPAWLAGCHWRRIKVSPQWIHWYVHNPRQALRAITQGPCPPTPTTMPTEGPDQTPKSPVPGGGRGEAAGGAGKASQQGVQEQLGKQGVVWETEGRLNRDAPSKIVWSPLSVVFFWPGPSLGQWNFDPLAPSTTAHPILTNATQGTLPVFCQEPKTNHNNCYSLIGTLG